MEAAPTLSVVIPYFRGAATIREAVQSALDQTVAADEIVICDDGSPDDLDRALGPLRPRVTVVRQANAGIAAAMNATTGAAGCDLLVQLDQDDAFMPRRLEAIREAAIANPDADVIATDAVVEYDGEPVLRLGDVHPFEAVDQRIAIIRSCFFLWPAIRRSRLLAVGGYDESFTVMQDWECFIRLILGGARATFVPEALYRWRLTPGSRSSADGVANAEALIRMMEKTVGSPTLDGAEREVAERELASHRLRLALERARLAIDTGARDARRRSFEVMSWQGASPARRTKAAVAVASPRLARLLLGRRGRRDPGMEALARRGFG